MLREQLEIFFRQGHGMPAYAYLIGVLAAVEFVLLTPPFMGTPMWSGAGNLFKWTAALAAVLTGYFALRAANREYAPTRFRTLDHWLRERGYPARVVAAGQLAFLSAHVIFSLLLIAPLLLWAGAISHTPAAAAAVSAVFALIAFYALCYGVWGLATLALSTGKLDERQSTARGLLAMIILIATLVYMPLNPVVFILSVASGEEPSRFSLVGAAWSPIIANVVFHLALGVCGFAAHRRALARGR